MEIIPPHPLREDQANPGKPREAQRQHCSCFPPRHTDPGNLPWLSLAPLLSGFRFLQKKKSCFWSWSKRVLQSCLNIAQGNRNAGQSSERSKNNTGLTAHSSASSPSLQPGPRDAGLAEQDRAVPQPRSTLGACLGRDELYTTPSLLCCAGAEGHHWPWRNPCPKGF